VISKGGYNVQVRLHRAFHIFLLPTSHLINILIQLFHPDIMAIYLFRVKSLLRDSVHRLISLASINQK
jgi:hypothetical protein